MKIRFTLGNIFGAITTAAGFIVDHQDKIVAASKAVADAPPTGKGLLIAGILILAGSKNFLTHQAHNIPEEKKVGTGPVIFEKTTILKPSGL